MDTNQRTSVKRFGSTEITYSYNDANLPIRKTNNFGGMKNLYEMSYYASGEKYLETDSINNITKQYKYNSLGQLSSEKNTRDGIMVLSAKYEYDVSGNRVKMSTLDGSNKVTGITSYTYDANNRLTQLSNADASGTISDMTRYYYDDNGNMIAEQKAVYTTGTEKSNMILSGRTGGGQMKTYQYDYFNRLVF